MVIESKELFENQFIEITPDDSLYTKASKIKYNLLVIEYKIYSLSGQEKDDVLKELEALEKHLESCQI